MRPAEASGKADSAGFTPALLMPCLRGKAQGPPFSTG